MKIYKINNKLVLYLPSDMIKELGLGENDEVDFLRYSDNAFLFTKKSDLVSLITKSKIEAPEEKVKRPGGEEKGGMSSISEEQVAVLKKLDTLRFPNRNARNVNKILGAREKTILQQLLDLKVVNLYKKNKIDEGLYSISKEIYDKFLMRKKQNKEGEKALAPKVANAVYFSRPINSRDGIENGNVKMLEETGYLVLQTEGEAASVSLALEESIRRGLVLGTRAFNKKFYIVTRQFFDKHNPSVLKSLREGKSKVDELAKSVGIDEDGARAILYLLSENGDAREKRRDIFVLA